MTVTSEALERLAALLAAYEETCQDYERDCPGAAECGYLSNEQRQALDLARGLLYRVTKNPKYLPEGKVMSRPDRIRAWVDRNYGGRESVFQELLDVAAGNKTGGEWAVRTLAAIFPGGQ